MSIERSEERSELEGRVSIESKAAPLTAPKGTFDNLPPGATRSLAAHEKLTRPLRRAAYNYIETPIFEDTALFRRGVGESTDVVSKEMYTFEDKGGRSLTLRPELTAGVMRAVIQHRLHAGQLPLKLYTVGLNFRYERTQAGRYRHFTQVDMEAIGVDDPALDAEVVALGVAGFRELGMQDFQTWLTSLGDKACRPSYRQLLQAYLRGLDLDDDTRRRAELNPLRVLDDKRPELQAQLADAPLMIDHLCDDCRRHYDEVRDHLTDLGVSWVEAPRMVRGLDYYTKTTFEYVHNGLGAQASIGGGGRYDGLSQALGGPDLSGIGYAVGVERTLLAADAEGLLLEDPATCQVYVVPLGAAGRRRAVLLIDELRNAGIDTDMAYGDRGLKGAMKAADRSRAMFAVILGDRDLETGSAQLKNLATGEQGPVPLADLVTTVKEKLK